MKLYLILINLVIDEYKFWNNFMSIYTLKINVALFLNMMIKLFYSSF